MPFLIFLRQIVTSAISKIPTGSVSLGSNNESGDMIDHYFLVFCIINIFFYLLFDVVVVVFHFSSLLVLFSTQDTSDRLEAVFPEFPTS